MKASPASLMALVLCAACSTASVPVESEPNLPNASCDPTSRGEIASVVGDTRWAASIRGVPPRVAVEFVMDGGLSMGLAPDGAVWEDPSRGTWDWVYASGDAQLVVGLTPEGASSQVELDDGTIVALCAIGGDLGHGVGYAIGAFPSAFRLAGVRIVSIDGALLGETSLSGLVEGAPAGSYSTAFSVDTVEP